MEVEIEVVEHKGYLEWVKSGRKDLPLYFGHHQFIYKRFDNIISLVEIKAGLGDNWLWEIYCIEGGLFEDVQRFASKQDAEDRIMAYLKLEEQI